MSEKRLIQVTMLPAASVVIAEEDYRELERLQQENAALSDALSAANADAVRLHHEVERLRALLREWQCDVGGASERLERDTLAAINGEPQTPPQTDKA